jgi:hypothetical protein
MRRSTLNRALQQDQVEFTLGPLPADVENNHLFSNSTNKRDYYAHPLGKLATMTKVLDVCIWNDINT